MNITTIIKDDKLSCDELISWKDLEIILSNLPLLLIEKRKQLGISQQEIANYIGMHYQQISKYENGGYRKASLKRILKILEAINEIEIEKRRQNSLE